MDNMLKQAIQDADRILVGIGSEWSVDRQPEVNRAYQSLYDLIKEKDYFIITTVTDGVIYDSPLDRGRIAAPCGNRRWRQCSAACTKDIWEAGEVQDDICPHCGKPLTGNTIEADIYIEEGYLPKWKSYTGWLAATLNRPLLVLELGEGFRTPTVIRWPFEKTVFLNNKAVMFRVHATYFQIAEELQGKITSIPQNSCEFFLKS